jgi:hypothetical protein
LGHAETVVAVIAGTASTAGVVGVSGIARISGLMVKKPQPLAQTCQSTPACDTSFATAALRLTVVLICICDGSDGTKLTLVASGLSVIGFELILTVGSAIDVAVSVTEVVGAVTEEAITGGAVYTLVIPLAV